MCGIYGTTKLYTREVIGRKMSSMRFRGPDHQGYKEYKLPQEKSLLLGHVRLSILDLDVRSNQPFDYNDDLSVVFNGEIYNYQTLKKQHLSHISFRTMSDTEVLCAMYEKYGNKCLQYLNGMFAFVIYDKKNNILFGARDRLGKKPFYYYFNNTCFEFASQLSPITIGNDKVFSISEKARQFFLFNGFIPDPYSIYNEIKKLEPSHFFTLNLYDFTMKIEKYWDIFSNSCHYEVPKSYMEAREFVKELLTDAVKIRLNADVPVGLFLSGGIDSSLTCAVASKINGNINAYTIGFDDTKFNESNYASQVANYLGIKFVTNKCEGNDMLRMFNNISAYFDEPFADFSMIPTCLLAEKSRQSVTVSLGGDGADEMFLGYYRHYSDIEKRKRVYSILPYSIRRTLFKALKKHPYGYHFRNIQYRSVYDSYICDGHYGHFYGAENYDYLSLANSLIDHGYFDNKRGVLSYSDNDIRYYLNSCINTKADRATMRSSLELRSPFMDYRIAEYSRLLPVDYLVDSKLGGKKILKDILYDIVPRDIMERPKMGFSPPIAQWYRNELKEYIVSNITEDTIQDMLPELKPKRVVQLRDEFLNGKRISGLMFFKIHIYQEWYKRNARI